DPRRPFSFSLLHQGQKAVFLEGVLPGGQRLVRTPSEFTVALANYTEGVLIKAEPDVQAVFENSLPVFRVAAAGAFASPAPPHLMYGDLVPVLPTRLIAEGKGRDNAAHAAAQDSNFLLTTRCRVHGLFLRLSTHD